MGVLGDDAAAHSARRRAIVEVAAFVAAAYAVTWCVVGAYVFLPETATRIGGPMRLGHPAFYLAVYAPSLIAFVLSFARGGFKDVATLVGGLFKVRAWWGWIALSVMAYPVLWLAASFVQSWLSGEAAQFAFSPWTVALPAIIFSTQILRDPGALGEEFGWRGYALPRLLDIMDGRAAALLLGVIWAVWHLPAFYVSTLSQSDVDFWGFFAEVVGLSIFMAFLFVNTNGSLLWGGVVPHFIVNATHRAGIGGEGWIAGLAGLVILLLAGKTLRGWRRQGARSEQTGEA